MKKPYAFFLFVMFLGNAVVAQKGITATAAVDKMAILIGEPVQLTLEATFSEPHTPFFFTIDTVPHFEVLSRSVTDTQATANQTILKQTITLTSWDSGAWTIPALLLPSVKSVATKPIAITVTYTPVPAARDYHDVKDIIDVERPPRTTWYWYVVGAVLLLLLLLLIFPKKKKTPAEEAALAKEGAYKLALKQLEVLQNKNIADEKDYFTELILIFRTYLQQGKGIHSFQQTTDDLSRQLQLSLPHEDLKKLVQTLQLSDFVKFARYSVTAAGRDHAREEIKQSIMALEQLKK